jgi:predicted ribonuclease YlaK|tara:strand:- start:519 stop:854 length:336 start_codon:yes stop_codon:yes gene_type:complete
MNTLQELQKLKQQTETLSKVARESKVGVDSLLRQRERLKAKLFLKHRYNATIKDAEMKAKADKDLKELDEKIDKAEIDYGRKWAEYEAHKIHIELLRSYHSTKRAELQQGL